MISVLLSSVAAQSAADKNIAELNEKAVSLYQDGKLNEALKIAKESLGLSLKQFGNNSLKTAISYINLGVIFREKKKFGDSADSLKQAARIYELNNIKQDEAVFNLYLSLAYSEELAGRKNEAAESMEKLLKSMEYKFGADSKDVFEPTLKLANLHASIGEQKKADTMYLKAYTGAAKNFGEVSREVRQISIERFCNRDILAKPDRLFDNEFELLFGKRLTKDFVFENILNGRALRLIKPSYPEEAKQNRLNGTVRY